MDIVGKYEVKPFSYYRQLVVDLMEEGSRRHHVAFCIEVDVTRARRQIRDYKKKTGESLSNTGWIIKCVSQAISENKEVQAFRHGRKKLIIFDDVDVWMAVEGPAGDERQIWPYVIRKANEKSVIEIHNEVRKAQGRFVKKNDAPDDPDTARLRNAKYVPKFIRMLFWWRLRQNAILAKKVGGTVAVTGVMGSRVSQWWGIPIGLHPLIINIGGFVKKPGVVYDRVEVREYVDLTIQYDHDSVDGSLVSRFIVRLAELIESAYGLEDVSDSDSVSFSLSSDSRA